MRKLENFYEVLGVRPNATVSEIRRAYREKVKLLHPDTSGNPATADDFNRVVQAYEVLSDVRSRSIFDESYFTRQHFKSSSKDAFNYRKWLLARHDDESRAKLIFFDLMHQREDDAVAEFKNMNMSRAGFSLKRWFTKENFMDYGFILSEELVLRQEYYDAALLLGQIILLERKYPYFKIFFPEVLLFERSILRNNIEGVINDELALDVFELALELGYPPSEDAFFLRKMSDIYTRIGDERTAAICMHEAVRITGDK